MKSELTAEINTFLLATGERQEISAEAVGSRVVLLGLDQKRKKLGSMLLLTPKTSRRIHQLAHKVDPAKRIKGCLECERITADRQAANRQA